MDNINRQQLVATTSRLLEAQGYHGTGLNQIIRESGAPRGSLYYYFPDGKEGLAAAAIAEQGARMRDFTVQLLNEDADPVAAVDRVLAALIELFSASQYCGGAPLAAVALETAAHSPRLRTTCAAAYNEMIDAFAAKLRAGGYPPARSARLATVIVAGIEGAVILSRTQQSTAPLALLREELGVLLRCHNTPT
jgi:TetR/AcrR family transcriptional repressor of lmrAB and yxaGH operons